MVSSLHDVIISLYGVITSLYAVVTLYECDCKLLLAKKFKWGGGLVSKLYKGFTIACNAFTTIYKGFTTIHNDFNIP